jgi:hypothetical protein
VSTIDYARMQRVFPKQKAALTRAKNSGNVYLVREACRKAVAEWDEIGAWPDDWALWERTLNDMLPWHSSEQLADLR